MSISAPLGRRTFLATSALLGLAGLCTTPPARADLSVDAELEIYGAVTR